MGYMNLDTTSEHVSTSTEQTEQLGETLAASLPRGASLTLSGDLGAGKTQLVRGIARALGSEDVVQSPSFTIMREYRCRDGQTIHHYDFYRLEDPGLMRDELTESVADQQVLTIVEWSEVVMEVLENSYRINISTHANGDRVIVINPPEVEK